MLDLDERFALTRGVAPARIWQRNPWYWVSAFLLAMVVVSIAWPILPEWRDEGGEQSKAGAVLLVFVIAIVGAGAMALWHDGGEQDRFQGAVRSWAESSRHRAEWSHLNAMIKDYEHRCKAYAIDPEMPGAFERLQQLEIEARLRQGCELFGVDFADPEMKAKLKAATLAKLEQLSARLEELDDAADWDEIFDIEESIEDAMADWETMLDATPITFKRPKRESDDEFDDELLDDLDEDADDEVTERSLSSIEAQPTNALSDQSVLVTPPVSQVAKPAPERVESLESDAARLAYERLKSRLKG